VVTGSDPALVAALSRYRVPSGRLTSKRCTLRYLAAIDPRGSTTIDVL